MQYTFLERLKESFCSGLGPVERLPYATLRHIHLRRFA